MTKALIQQALQALEYVCDQTRPRPIIADAIAALRAHLAQPEQEPVAHCHLEMWRSGAHHAQDCFAEAAFEGSVPLYAAPPAPAMVPMTEAEIAMLFDQSCKQPSGGGVIWFARAVEAHHGIGAARPGEKG